MNFYDSFGIGTYAPVSQNDIQNSTGSIDGGVFSGVPISSSDTAQKRQPPDFKALFEDYQMHNPDIHRAYYLTWPMINGARYDGDPSDGYPYYPRLSWEDELKPFDKTNIELQTLKKEDNDYVTLSTDTINHLKYMDERFVKSVVGYTAQRDAWQSSYNDLPDYKKDGTQGKGMLKDIAHFNTRINSVNNAFKSYVADFSASVVALNKPFYVEQQNEQGEMVYFPVSLGNFTAYDIDEIINDIFGNVTGDDFIPALNEERYNQRAETTCCLQYCIAPELYRMKDVPYEQSEQKVIDGIEFEKYKNSDEFTPYTPPAPYKKISVDQYMNYLKNAQQFLNSPLMYVFEKMKPYINEGLAYLKGQGYITAYKINGNNVNIETDLRNFFN